MVGLGPNHEPAAEGAGGGAAAGGPLHGSSSSAANGSAAWPAPRQTFARLRDDLPQARLDLVGEHPPVSVPGVTGHGPLRLDRPDEAARVSALSAGGDLLRDALGGRAVRPRLHRGGARGRAEHRDERRRRGDDRRRRDGPAAPPGDEAALLDAMRTLADPAEARPNGRGGPRALAAVHVGEGWRAVAARARTPWRRPGGVPVSWAICVLNWNGREDALRCLASLRAPWVIVGDTARPTAASGDPVRVPGCRGGRERRQPWLLWRQQRGDPACAGARGGVGGAAQQRRRGRAGDARGAAGGGRRHRAPVATGKLLYPDGRVQWAGQRVGLRTGYSGRPRGHGQPDGFTYSVEGQRTARSAR